MKLERKRKYLQIAFNTTLEEALKIIEILPIDERIILEVGTPLIKVYGMKAISEIKKFWLFKLGGVLKDYLWVKKTKNASLIASYERKLFLKAQKKLPFLPYVVADMKCMDRAKREVEIAKDAGADAITVLGQASLETIKTFIKECKRQNLDSMIDMMNVDFPLRILRNLEDLPDVVLLHRGVDEEKEKELPFFEIQRIKNFYDIMISIAGGERLEDVRSGYFNEADIVVLWKVFSEKDPFLKEKIKRFLREVK